MSQIMNGSGLPANLKAS